LRDHFAFLQNSWPVLGSSFAFLQNCPAKHDGYQSPSCYLQKMKFRPFYLLLPTALAFILFASPIVSFAMSVEERPDLMEVFTQENVTGSFALYDPSNDTLTLVNAERAAQRGIPASTFKIANSLIALETGVVRDENEIIPYGGKPQFLKIWEQDMSMRDAIRISNVPVYQELARRIGIARYKDWLARLNYGNEQIGADVETFWIGGPLTISPIEQTHFLSKLAQLKLPFTKQTQKTVADILKLESNNGRVLYGKTGWTITPTPHLGWFVGWVENEREIYAFALNMDINSNTDAKKRKGLAKALLKKLDIY
jgi:beta-lactamase class D